MKIFDLLQKGLYEIKATLLGNSDIRKLVFHDTIDALENIQVSTENVDDHIVISPIFDMNQEPFNKNTIISIALNRASFEDDTVMTSSIIKINVLTQSTLWKLNNNLIRPLQISNLIIDLLNNRKFSSSHKMSFISLELAILDEKVNGYTLSFYLHEGSGILDEY